MYVVILAGGSGTRFWPVSRGALPKQLISIAGGATMLQRTVERVLPLKPKRLLVVTNSMQVEESRRQLSGYAGQVPIDLIAEPVGRNTAPAIGLAATIIAAKDPAGMMVVLPADHYIRNEDRLRERLTAAVATARSGWLVTLGITPTCPETGYGYIEAELEGGDSGPYPVRRFVEKPPIEQAIAYLEAKNFFWNSGMFVWQVDTILSEMATCMPQLSAQLSEIRFNADVWELSDLESQIVALYSRISSQSIDFGVMERSNRVKMIPADIGWSDVGSWSAMPDIASADACNNVAVNAEKHIAIDSKGCIVSGNGGIVATIGVNDLVVVNSGDATLVCPKDRAQDVKLVVEQLKTLGLERYL
jgi:mannose-1-phosphate guanylyltransferase